MLFLNTCFTLYLMIAEYKFPLLKADGRSLILVTDEYPALFNNFFKKEKFIGYGTQGLETSVSYSTIKKQPLLLRELSYFQKTSFYLLQNEGNWPSGFH